MTQRSWLHKRNEKRKKTGMVKWKTTKLRRKLKKREKNPKRKREKWLEKRKPTTKFLRRKELSESKGTNCIRSSEETRLGSFNLWRTCCCYRAGMLRERFLFLKNIIWRKDDNYLMLIFFMRSLNIYNCFSVVREKKQNKRLQRNFLS